MNVSLISRYVAAGLLIGGVLMCSACNEQPTPSGRKGKSPPPHLVEVHTIQSSNLQVNHERTGTLKYRKLAHIYSQIEGRITLFPWFEGDEVQQNAVLVQLDDRLLRAEQAKTNANVRQARQDLERIRKLVARKVASEDELMRAHTNLDVAKAEQEILNTRISYAEIRAPFAGVITERLAEPGDVTDRHSHLLTIADSESMIVEVSVSELLLPQLSTGDLVSIRIDALEAEKFQGSILRIHPQLSPDSRQGLVEIQLDQRIKGMQAGQFARVTFSTSMSSKLMIPFTALHRDRRGEYVYLMQDGKARYAEVKSGIRIGQEVEVRNGLTAGQQIITRGFLGLSDSKKVKPVNQSHQNIKTNID